MCGLSLGCWGLLLWGQVQDSGCLTRVCVWGDCPGSRQESFALSGPAPAAWALTPCSSQASCTPSQAGCAVNTPSLCSIPTPEQPTNRVWDLGKKSLSVLFSLPVFLYCLSWGLLPLSEEGMELARAAWAGLSHSWKRQGAGTNPAACPFSPPHRLPCTGLRKGTLRSCWLRANRAAGMVPSQPWENSAVLAPQAHGQRLPSRSRRLAVLWLGSAWHVEKARSECSARR